VIDADLARRLDFSVVVEAANLPLTGAAQEVAAARGITVVPDFVANAGGVVAAAFAMDARYSAFPVEPETVFPVISAKMRGNTTSLLAANALHPHETTHVTARRLAAERVGAARS
jgi:glutamate dehydrogenase (NAD(P)+)